MDLAPPLRLERRRANDQHLANVGLSGQHLGDADALDRFAQPHVVGQYGPAGTDGEGDAVQLIGKQLGLEQLFPQRMLGGIATDFIDERSNSGLNTAVVG